MLKLSGEELIRWFMLHLLPKGFMRIRHYGFLANCVRGKCLEQIRTAIKALPGTGVIGEQQKVNSGQARIGSTLGIRHVISENNIIANERAQAQR